MAATSRSIHRREYLSLVYYLAEPPAQWSDISDGIIRAAVQLFGPKQKVIVVWDHAMQVALPDKPKERRFALGSAELGKLCRENRNCTLALIAENRESRRMGPREFAWEVEWEPKPVASGIAFEPYLGVSWGLTFLAEKQIQMLSPLVKKFGLMLGDLGNPYHGLIDVGITEETGYGNLYQSIEPGYVSYERRVRRLVWLRSGKRRRHTLRGVFWGQLLSAPMVRRLGDRDRFVAEYADLEDPADRNLIDILANGSMFIRLSSSITTVRRPFAELLPSTLERAAWLYERFTAAGIL